MEGRKEEKRKIKREKENIREEKKRRKIQENEIGEEKESQHEKNRNKNK